MGEDQLRLSELARKTAEELSAGSTDFTYALEFKQILDTRQLFPQDNCMTAKDTFYMPICTAMRWDREIKSYGQLGDEMRKLSAGIRDRILGKSEATQEIELIKRISFEYRFQVYGANRPS